MSAGGRSVRIVVAGTGTEVGKTWTTARLLELARARGLRVAARKPAQSYAPEDAATDADLLARASGERPHDVCPAHRWYPVPMAPPMAAELLRGERLRLDDLLAETPWPDADVAFIETAGGLCSPIAHDGDNLALIERLAPTNVLLVADAGLGTLNSVRLCLRALGTQPTVVFLNRYQAANELHRRNAEWLVGEGIAVGRNLDELERELIGM